MEKIYHKIKNNKIVFIVFIILLTLISSINLLHKGVTLSHDINFHMNRIMALTDNLRIHKYSPIYYKYLKRFGYGNGLFYPDIFIYIPAFLKYIGLKVEFSYKIFIISINLLSILTMYLCVVKITKKKYCAYTSMILYACSSYRLVDLIERGALGEVISFVFIPLVILGLYEILYGDNKTSIFLALGLIGLCLSHIISLYLACISITIIVLINIKCLKEKKRLVTLILNVITAMLITSFFWMPMLEQILSNKFNFFINTDINNNIIPIYALFIDFPLIETFKIWLPSGIGIIYYYGIYKYYKSKNTDKFLLSMFLIGLISIATASVKYIWKINLFNKILCVIQFPWRFYMTATCFLIVGLCILIKELNKKTIKIIITYTVTIFIINTTIYEHSVYIDEPLTKNNNYVHNPLETEVLYGEYLPKGFYLDLIDEYDNKNITYERNNNITKVEVKKGKKIIEVPLVYYKGYEACGKKCYEVFKTDKGLLGIKTENEIDSINIEYKGTKIQKISKYISALSIITITISTLKKKRKYDKFYKIRDIKTAQENKQKGV